MARRKKVEKVFPRETESFGTPKERIIKSVEKEQPLILYSFPDIDGVKITVKARSMEEAIKKAREEVNRRQNG